MLLSQKKTAKIKDDKDKNIYLPNNVYYPTVLNKTLTTLDYIL